MWNDFNNDGEVNFGETAIAGVAVELTGLDDRGQAVSRSVDDGRRRHLRLHRPAAEQRRRLHDPASRSPPASWTGAMSLGTVNGVTVGNASVNDTFSGVVLPRPASLAENYNFGERPAANGGVTAGQTATIGFWQNKNGQNLIKSLNGGATATQLGNWLAATFPNMYGASAGANNLAGKTNAEVAAFYKTLFARTASTAAGGGPPKMDAQVMATALAVYVTNQSLAGTTAAAYGFLVTANGVGTRTFNVGGNGAAFGVANNSKVTVLDLLLAVNTRSQKRPAVRSRRRRRCQRRPGNELPHDGQRRLQRHQRSGRYLRLSCWNDVNKKLAGEASPRSRFLTGQSRPGHLVCALQADAFL